MKYCYECRISKEKKLFRKHRLICRKCEQNKFNIYTKTIDGLITRIYSSQKSNSKSRGMVNPLYSKIELKDWLFRQNNFIKLYKNWQDNDYVKEKKPSVDRLIDNLPYSLDNIRLVTWKENESSARKDMKVGLLKAGIGLKPIAQLDKDNNHLADFISISDAERKTNIPHQNIIKCLKGKRNTAGGYKWQYK